MPTKTKTRRFKRIDQDTAIWPHLVAETVWGTSDDVKKLSCFPWNSDNTLRPGFPGPQGDEYERLRAWFVDHAERRANYLYHHNDSFRKGIRCRRDNAGRDFLYKFMYHWIKGFCADPERYMEQHIADVIPPQNRSHFTKLGE